jgi:DNA-directed RNA polymerase subunit H (RpoH/RPB5)
MSNFYRRLANDGYPFHLFQERGDEYYSMDVAKDEFVHFTSEENAKKILEEGMLRKDKVPNGRPDAIYAVSVLWGSFVGNTQVPKGITPVAILFKTLDKPKYGYPEEVVWGADVHLAPGARILSMEEAKGLLSKAQRIEGTVKYI